MVDGDQRDGFAAARDTTKQLITLAISVVTVTVTFIGDVSPPRAVGSGGILLAAWIGYTASVGFGVVELLALTAELDQTRHAPSARRWTVRWPIVLQGVAFMAATSVIVWFGSRTALGAR